MRLRIVILEASKPSILPPGALFVNPFGYDALFAWTMKQTGSFMTADLIFYGIAFMFFGLYFYLIRLHPIKYTIQTFDLIRLKILNLF